MRDTKTRKRRLFSLD